MGELIKAITFDLWNTLLVEKSYTERRISVLAEELGGEGQGVDWEALRFANAEAQKRHDDLWSNKHCHYPLAERLEYTLKNAGVTLSPTSIERVMEKYVEIILEDPPQLTAGSADVISQLAPRFKLGIISDTGVTKGKQIRRVLDDYGILHHFKATVFSDETTVCKPRREAFEFALKRLKVIPGESLHVGDLLRTDVAGAKAAGMKGVWLKVKEPDVPNVAPDFVIKSLRELIEIPEIVERL